MRAKRMLAMALKQKLVQADYNRVEKEMIHLVPLVNEANIAAQELKRDLKFSTRLVKELNPFLKDGMMTSGKTNVVIKVENHEENYFYEWPADKFSNRIFMIRELLEEFFDTGELPVLTKEEDPFWDPPNPILVGQSFLQLQNLSLYFENKMENAAILSIDGKGGKNGTICVEYLPCNKVGETEEDGLDEEFIVSEANEMIGKRNLYFKVLITNAMGLPPTICKNPFVTY